MMTRISIIHAVEKPKRGNRLVGRRLASAMVGIFSLVTSVCLSLSFRSVLLLNAYACRIIKCEYNVFVHSCV
jgi:hypothetical protein